MRQLLTIAGQLGYRVHIAHIDDEPDLLGYTVASERMIVLRMGMTRNQTMTVLAHELGHAHFGHTCDSEANERQAEAFAASLLIDPAAYATAERISADPHFIADELGVTTDLVAAFRERLVTRLRGVSYVRPRIGAGQAQFRSAHA